MIIVYPLLVSRAVSDTSIPGICKSLENYILINKQDMVINDVNKIGPGSGSLRKIGKQLVMREDVGVPPGSGGGSKTKTAGVPPGSGGGSKSKYKEKEDKEKEDKEKKEKAAKNAQVNVRVTDNRSISMEPTTMEIDRVDKEGNKSRMFLGVKVVPMRVSSDVKLSHLILFDANLSSLSAMMISLGRKILRGFYTIIDRWLRGKPLPTGDPRHDILMGRTGMGRDSETFIVLSKQEDIDEFFLDNISKMYKLFKMGWENIIIADDIARVAYFCTGELRGMCSGVPYAMMYQNLGQAKAYETMEDAKKANSSIFKISKQFTRVLGECKHDLKLLTYTQLNEDNKNE